MDFFETLYKSDDPKDFPDGEYFQPRVQSKSINGVEMFFVTEKHAYYSDTEKRRVNETFTLNPEEGFPTEAEAMKRYDEQVKYRASTGYVHLFHFDPFKPNGVAYRYIG